MPILNSGVSALAQDGLCTGGTVLYYPNRVERAIHSLDSTDPLRFSFVLTLLVFAQAS